MDGRGAGADGRVGKAATGELGRPSRGKGGGRLWEELGGRRWSDGGAGGGVGVAEMALEGGLCAINAQWGL